MSAQPRTLYSKKDLGKRIASLGRSISKDYSGKTLDIIVLIENGFVFAADLIRQIDCPVICHFMRSELRDVEMSGYSRREVFFSRPPVLKNRNVLLVDAVLQTGVTHDFLTKRLLEAKPRSLKIAVLVDKPAERRVDLRADYFGFVGASKLLVGYGLAGRQGLFRNLDFIGTMGHAGSARRASSAATRRKPQRHKVM